VYLTAKFGFGKVLRFFLLLSAMMLIHIQMILFGAVLQTCTYIIQAPAGPLATFVAAYLIDGLGMGFQVGTATATPS
jgi:hypothetical protein